MEYRVMGKTGLKVSAIGFGCWPMGGTQYGPVEDQDSVRAVHKALDLGINCFDTAAGYGLGHAEVVLGKALGARRKDVYVVTKCGLVWNEAEKRFDRDSSQAHIMKAVEESLKNLSTDYIDVYLIHWPDVETPFSESMQAMEDLVKQGKVRHVGVSNFSAEQMKECQKTRPVEVEQVGYHLFDRRMEKEVLPFCRAENIGVMGYGSLAHGLLTGALTEDTKFVDWDWRSKGEAFGLPIFKGEHFKKNVRIVEELKKMARARGKTISQLALSWVLSNAAISIALVGARRPEEIEESAGVAGWKPSKGEMDKIEALFKEANIEYEYR
jgi:aryl-alcohol dehydrogenase-like predicted oxidoreductase